MSKGINEFSNNERGMFSTCPTCGEKTLFVYECNECGKVFCPYCETDNFNLDEEIEHLEVSCPNKCTLTLFVG